MNQQARRVNCPTCAVQVAWVPQNRFRPFCSERCRLVDLGAWATERYRVAGPEAEPTEGALGAQNDGPKD
jgi:endogenous inhibitor of DNA gyrase (YacG/DUF329 family)